MSRYLHRVLMTLSILVNVIAGGQSNQTISARNYEWKRQGKPNLVWLIDYLTYEPDHCMLCWVNWTLIRDALKG